MTSLKSLLNCIGVDTSGDVSVLGSFFGFSRNRLPTDPDRSVKTSVSMLQQIRDIQGKHVHLNIISVGFDTLSDTDQANALAKIDYAIYRTRNIYRRVNLGVGRIQHWVISAADSNGRDDLGSEDEAEALWNEWSSPVPNNGIDVFIVRNISDSDFIGISPLGGNCDRAKDDGLIGGAINRDFEGFSRTFAHEIGHFLGLSHNHGDNCPTSTEGKNNLMAQTKCAISTRNSVDLDASQGDDVRDHCSGQDGC